MTSERVFVNASSMSAAVTPVERARTARRAPRGSCACTARTRATTDSAESPGGPAKSCDVRRAATRRFGFGTGAQSPPFERNPELFRVSFERWTSRGSRYVTTMIPGWPCAHVGVAEQADALG